MRMRGYSSSRGHDEKAEARILKIQKTQSNPTCASPHLFFSLPSSKPSLMFLLHPKPPCSSGYPGADADLGTRRMEMNVAKCTHVEKDIFVHSTSYDHSFFGVPIKILQRRARYSTWSQYMKTVTSRRSSNPTVCDHPVLQGTSEA